MIKRFFILLLAIVASVGMSFAQDPGIVSSGTKGGMSYTFYDNGLLEISGSGALPGQAFTNWDGGFGTSVKNIRFAEDCEVYGLDYLWFACYTENSQLETVEMNSVAPILFSGTSGAGIFYRQDGAVTITITAPGIVDVENRIIDNYGSPVNMIFNMPATTVFERKWFSGLENYFAVTIPTGAKGHIPAGYVFKDSYDQEDYDRLVADGYEDMFWDTHSHLEEGVDYTLGEESTFEITAENASQIFGQATVSFQAPTEASNSEWVLWRKSDLKEFSDMSSGNQKVCKDVTVKVNNGVYNTDSGWGIHFESLAEDGVQFVAPEGKVFKRIVILNQYGTFSDPNWSYDGNYKRWSGSADTVGFVGNICGISLIEFEVGDSDPAAPANSCGGGLTWELNNGALTISYDGEGTGVMNDYDIPNDNPAPWYANRENITSVSLPEGIKTIGKDAFRDCVNLTTVTIPNSVTTIGESAFVTVEHLETVTIGTGITSIVNGAFYGCEALTTVTCSATTPPSIGAMVFGSCTNLEHIYVPAESVDAYKTAWSAYASLISTDGGGSEPGDEGKLPGAFSINANGDKVQFAKGNLQATTTDLGANWTWDFAPNQWSLIGNAVANNAITGNKTVSANGTVDLFGWSTAATYYGINKSWNNDDYAGDFVDWGALMGTGWRTLSRAEFRYIVFDRAQAFNKQGKATVNGVSGYIFLPDEWELPSGLSFTPSPGDYTTNQYDGADWDAMENAGAVFLPAAGDRSGSDIYMYDYGWYWTSTSTEDSKAYYLYFYEKSRDFVEHNRYDAKSVRLVTVAPKTPADVMALIDAIGTVDSSPESKAKIDAARAAYDALSDGDKALVTNYSTLTDAETAYADAKQAADQAAAAPVIALINQLPNPMTAADAKLSIYTKVQDARAAYDALTADQKLLVTNLAVLEAAEAAFAAIGGGGGVPTVVVIYKSEFTSTGVTKEGVNLALSNGSMTAGDPLAMDGSFEFSTSLGKFTNITIETDINIMQIDEGAYTSAGWPTGQNLGTSAVWTGESETVLISCMVAGNAITITCTVAPASVIADAIAARDLINAIPDPVTLEDACVNAIQAARAAVDALGENAKLIDAADMAKLTDAEAALTALNQAEADAVTAKINNIPTPVTLKLATLDSIQNARTAYDALTADQKALVTNYPVLTAAEEALAEKNPSGGAPLPEGALTGAFSINADGDKIAFSKGNLQATTANLGETWTWAFAANQYDYVGNAVANTAITGNKTVSTNGTIDLFGWSTAATYYGINNSNVSGKHPGDFIDWGETIAEGWRTLTRDEWNYLFETRTDAASKYGHATVAGIHGIIVLPDSYKGTAINADHSDWSNNIISAEDWAAYEANGVAFLPAAGSRLATNVNYVGEYAFYWTSTTYGEKWAYRVRFVPELSPDYGDRVPGQSVRLVTAHTGDATPLDSAQAVKDLIDAIPVPVTLNDSDAIQAARDAYDALSEAAQGALDAATVQKLTDAEQALKDLNQAEADKVIAKINNIPTPVELKLATRDSIQNARTAYDALTTEQQALVTNYQKLLDAEAALAEKNPGGGMPAGALNGKFSINADGDQISFAKGNLQATTEDNGANWTWSFAANQWNCLGIAVANSKINGNGTVSENGTVDLFGWSTAATYYGINNSYKAVDYIGDFVDWGPKMGAGWRTLTKDEWNYLIENNTKGRATVNDKNGYIFLPDNWSGPAFTPDPDNFTTNVYSGDDWTAMENAGAVFLPCGPARNGTYALIANDAKYCSSTSLNNDTSYVFTIYYNQSQSACTGTNRAYGCMVRLVTEGGGATPLDSAQAVKDLIDAIPVPVTLDSKDEIDAARDAYDALADLTKGALDDATVTKLTDAEDAYAALIKEATDVIALINAIPQPVVYNEACGDSIIAARNAYDALSDELKPLVTNYPVLTDAEDAYEKAKAAKEAAEPVIVKINNIPQPVELKLATRDSIQAAREAYDALIDDQMKDSVTNYAVLEAAEATWAGLTNVAPAGALSGKYTINAGGDVIYFAHGNLQYTRENLDADWSTGTFRLATNQYDLIELVKSSPDSYCTDNYGDKTAVGLFGWGTWGEGKTPNLTSSDRTLYTWSTDFSGTLEGTDTWRTLSKDEWVYLLAHNNQSYATVHGVNGLLVAPDGKDIEGKSMTDWVEINDETWTTMQNDGYLFLPACGQRSQLSTTANIVTGGQGTEILYYSSTQYSDVYAYNIWYKPGQDPAADDHSNKRQAFGVRLVAAGANPLDQAQAVKDLIDAIPTPVEYPTSGPAIAAALVAYNQLSDAAKGALDAADVQKMTDAATQYAALDAIAAIEAIPAEIVYDPAVKAAIETAREKYDDLIDASKALVSPEVLQKLIDAEEAWAILAAKIEHNVSYIGKDGELKHETVALLHIPDPAPDFNGYEFVRWDVKAGDFLEEGLRIKAVYTPIITTNPVAYDSLMYNGTAQTLITAGVAKEGHIEYRINDGEWSAELPKATFAAAYVVYYKLVREGHADYIADSIVSIIAKAPVVYTAPTAYDTLVYNASNQTLIAAGQTQHGTFEYSLDPTLLDSWKTALPQAMAAGTYNVFYRVQGDLNHLDSTAVDPIAVTIAKAALTATADNKSVIYGNQAPEFTVTYAGWQGDDDATVLTGDIAFACDYNDTTSVGAYPIVPSGVTADNYAIEFVPGLLTVGKAESGCLAPVAYDTLVYNGAAQTLIIAGQPLGGEIQYSLDTTVANCWSTALPQAKDAGTYNVYYRVKGDKNHNDSYYPLIAVNIAKASLTATAEDKTVTYGDPAPAYTVAYTGWKGTDEASVLTGTIAYACTYAPLSNVGEYTITPSGVDAANYIITFVNGKVTVVKAPVAYVAPVANELTYTAAAQTLITAGTTNDGQFVYRLGTQGEYDGVLPQATHVGAYDVYYKVLGDGNHLDSIIAAPVAVSVAKAPLTATADNKSVIFGEPIPSYTVTYAGWLGQDKDTVLTGAIAYACEYVKGSQVGEYTITPSGVDAADYQITFLTGKVTVNRKSAKSDDITAKQADNETLVYDAAANRPTIQVKDTTLVLTENTDYKLTFIGRGNTQYAESATAPAHVGDYTAVVAFIGNYKDTLTVDFVINKAPLTITADNKEVTFGEFAPEFTVSYAGWQGTDTATVLTGVQAYACEYERGNNVGEYTITPSGVDAHDYAITFVDGTLTVNRKSAKSADIAAKQADNETLVYDAEVNRPTIQVKDTTLVLTETQDYVLTFKGVAADQSTYAESETAPTHVGNYTAVVAFVGNYIDTLTVDFTINKAPLTITANDTAMIYGDPAPEFTVSYNGFHGNDDASVLLGTQAYDCIYAPGSPIGTYVITPKGVDAYDYAISFVDGTLTVNKAHVYISGAEVHEAKFADGHANAEVTKQGTLNGIKVNDPIAHVTTAAFSSADVAENLTITLFYELTGDAALLSNYDLDPTSEIYSTEGVIIEPFIPNDDHQPGEEEQVEVQEGIDVYAYGYCDGSGYSLKYHLNAGNPNQYKIDFADSRFTDIDWTNLTNAGKDGTIDIDIPVDMPTGDYSMTVYFRDSRFDWLESQALTVTFHVNLPETYIRPLFDNVIALIDTCHCLTDIQWYWRANSTDTWEPIPGANGYYYHSDTKLTGEYFVKAKMNGMDTYTCGQTDLETLYGDNNKQQAQVKAYPNPVQNTTTVTIEGSTEWEHSLRIVNLTGSEMLNTTFEGNETNVEMTGYPIGNYMISVDGIVVKVMKQ